MLKIQMSHIFSVRIQNQDTLSVTCSPKGNLQVNFADDTKLLLPRCMISTQNGYKFGCLCIQKCNVHKFVIKT